MNTALAFLSLDLQHPHLVIVDGSKLVRKILTSMMAKTLPNAVITECDSDPRNQSQLIQLGANDLVQKPIEERLLITKLMFQLRMGKTGRLPAL